MEVVVPLFGVRDTAVLAISTPLDSENYYSQLLEAKRPDGRPLFNVVNIALLCDTCRTAGLLECPHKAELPPWKTGERQELVRSLMAGRDAAMYAREALGVVTRNTHNVFSSRDLARLTDRANRAAPRELGAPSHVFVCVDPCGGGASSMAAVSGVFLASGELVLVAADAARVTSDAEQERFLGGHLRRVRDVQGLASSLLVLIIERNYGGGVLASRIAGLAAPFAPVAAMTQDSDPKLRRCGVVTTGPVKERMRVEMARLLASGTLRLHAEMASDLPDAPGTLVSQLGEYRMEVVPGNEATGRGPRIYLTGKSFGKSDDLAITAQMLTFWAPRFFADGERCLM